MVQKGFQPLVNEPGNLLIIPGRIHAGNPDHLLGELQKFIGPAINLVKDFSEHFGDGHRIAPRYGYH
jgi:hypothetical protein